MKRLLKVFSLIFLFIVAFFLFSSEARANFAESFAEVLHKMSEEVRSQNSINKESSVLAPNDPQIKISKERTLLGIPISDKIYNLLEKV